MIEPPAVPASPKRHHTAMSRITGQHPLSVPTDDTGQITPDSTDLTVSINNTPQAAATQKNSINSWNNFQNTLAEQDAERKRVAAARRAARFAEEENSGGRHEPELPAMKETWRQVKVLETGEMGHANQRRVVKVLKRPVGGSPHTQQIQATQAVRQDAISDASTQPAPAPYQATSNIPETKLQYPDIYRPTIPAANKLPMPKLTEHSSSLLNLFKDGKSVNAATARKEIFSLPPMTPDLLAPVEAATSQKIKERVSRRPTYKSPQSPLALFHVLRHRVRKRRANRNGHNQRTKPLFLTCSVSRRSPYMDQYHHHQNRQLWMFPQMLSSCQRRLVLVTQESLPKSMSRHCRNPVRCPPSQSRCESALEWAPSLENCQCLLLSVVLSTCHSSRW